jgi:beta-glucosidase
VGQERFYYKLPTGRPIQHPDPAHPGYVEMKYGSRYLDVPNDALFPPGHGLTYSTFAYSGVSLSAQSISSASLMRDPKSQPVIATATVTNTGKSPMPLHRLRKNQCFVSGPDFRSGPDTK